METARYKHLHYWLLIPFIITIAGFIPSYWSQFSSATLGWHLHALSATLWFSLLVIQPFLISHGHANLHRKFGMIALLIAGFVAASALAVIRGHIHDLDPEYDIIYPYRYSLSLTDFIYIGGFLFALTMAVIHSKRIDWHSRWMISSVFWVLSPATDRLVYAVFQLFGMTNLSWFNFEAQYGISHGVLIIGVSILMVFDRSAGKASYIPFGLVVLAQIMAPIMLIGLKDSVALGHWFESLFRLPY